MPSGRRTKTKPESPKVEKSSGNVFADLDVSNPDLALVKAQLVKRIRDLITEQGLTQTRAAEKLGIDQPKVSNLLRGNVSGYTLDRLFRFLTALGQRFEIKMSARAGSRSAADSYAIRVS